MAGRDRKGVDARGSIGDKEYITLSGLGEPAPKSGLSSGILPGKVMGFGLLVILAGCVIWLWPIIDLYVKYLTSLPTGPQIIGWGFILILLSVFSRIVINPIIDMILR